MCVVSEASVSADARTARDAGASCSCRGAAWRSPADRDIPKVAGMIRGVKAPQLETCVTPDMLSGRQAESFNEPGLDYSDHNVDTERTIM